MPRPDRQQKPPYSVCIAEQLESSIGDETVTGIKIETDRTNKINLSRNINKADALHELRRHVAPDLVIRDSNEIKKLHNDLMLPGPYASRQRYFHAKDIRRIEEASTTILYPPILFNGLPSSFPQWDTRFPMVTSANAYQIAKIESGYVGMVYDAPAIFNHDLQLEPEFSSYYSVLKGYVDDGNNIDFSKSTIIDGDVFVMLDDVGGLNYSHWLCDWLPRLKAIQGNNDVYVLTLPLNHKWQIDLLQACGIEPDRCISLPQWGSLHAKNVYVPSALSHIFHPAYKGARWVREFLRENILGKSSASLGPRIYLSRKDAPERHVLNEGELEAYLKSIGFQCFVASEYTPIEQASIFNNAQAVVSLHGAGLTNLMFCKPGTRVLEIIPKNYSTPAFWIIASACKLIYGTYICEHTVTSPTRAHEQANNVVVDIEDMSRLAHDYLRYD